jgi:hypothetical protein
LCSSAGVGLGIDFSVCFRQKYNIIVDYYKFITL